MHSVSTDFDTLEEVYFSISCLNISLYLTLGSSLELGSSSSAPVS